MDDADAFSFLYEREGEAVFFFLARRTTNRQNPGGQIRRQDSLSAARP